MQKRTAYRYLLTNVNNEYNVCAFLIGFLGELFGNNI